MGKRSRRQKRKHGATNQDDDKGNEITNKGDSSEAANDAAAATTTTNKEEPITAEGSMPQKKFYRSRAHCNPLSHNDKFDYPTHPSQVDWNSAEFYPNLSSPDPPNIVDVGCGYGGLSIAMSQNLPSDEGWRILAVEIRAKVAEYVRLRIQALRRAEKDTAENVAVLRTNSMKYLVHYLPKASVSKLFFCFPDPHFKRKNHPRRIISTTLLTDYAYLLKPIVGRLYCITDVEELHQWHVDKCNAHPLFRKLSEEELKDDQVCVQAMIQDTEEGKKVERAGTAKYYAVYQRVANAEATAVPMTQDDFFAPQQFGVFFDKEDDNDDDDANNEGGKGEEGRKDGADDDGKEGRNGDGGAEDDKEPESKRKKNDDHQVRSNHNKNKPPPATTT